MQHPSSAVSVQQVLAHERNAHRLVECPVSRLCRPLLMQCRRQQLHHTRGATAGAGHHQQAQGAEAGSSAHYCRASRVADLLLAHIHAPCAAWRPQVLRRLQLHNYEWPCLEVCHEVQSELLSLASVDLRRRDVIFLAELIDLGMSNELMERVEALDLSRNNLTAPQVVMAALYAAKLHSLTDLEYVAHRERWRVRARQHMTNSPPPSTTTTATAVDTRVACAPPPPVCLATS